MGIGRHRRCGCDCGDQNRWVKDPLIEPSTCYTGCKDGAKAPCKYIANFECNIPCLDGTNLAARTVATVPSRAHPEAGVVLRPYCIWSDAGRYVSIYDNTDFKYANGANDACDWATRLNSEGLGYQFLEDNVNWELRIDLTPVALTHRNGIRYTQPLGNTWDCFGPNTLILVDNPIVNQKCPSVPKYVCITPAVKAIPAPKGCCTNCFTFDLPDIYFVDGIDNSKVVAQKVELLDYYYDGGLAGQFLTRTVPCKYTAEYIVHENATGNSNNNGGQARGKNPIILLVDSPLDEVQTSSAEIIFRRITENGSTDIRYQCQYFSCNGGYFQHVSGGAGEWPSSITVTGQPCIRSEQYDQGPTTECGARQHFYLGTTGYSDEQDRCGCCDPWGECMPGYLKVYCPGNTTPQAIQACPAFCVGGRLGIADRSGPSREWCVTINNCDDNTPHTICMVAFCASPGVWVVDWYCDGTYVSTTGFTGVSCCPSRRWALMPTIACLGDATGCVGVNMEPPCDPPAEPCCVDEGLPGTLNVTLTTTCSGWGGSLACTMTGSYPTWTGSCINAASDTINFSFDQSTCILAISCDDGGGVNVDMTAVDCTAGSVMMTGTSIGLLFFSCGCGGSDTFIVTIED